MTEQFAGINAKRFVINDCTLPAFRKLGIVWEVVDTKHPSDRGPMAISFHVDRVEADKVCTALNLIDSF